MPFRLALPRFVRAALVPAAVLALGVPAPDAAQAQPGDSYRYAFRIETGDGDPVRGVTHVSGGRSRIELAEKSGRRSTGYLLVSGDGRTLTAVDPEKREYSETNAADFEHIVGTAMEAADRVMTLDLHDLEVTGRRLGAGGRVAGHDTQHSRLGVTYGLRVGALGFTARQRHAVDVEYWVAPGLRLPRNPMIELFASLPTVLAQHDRDFVTRLRAGRDALVGPGTPLRVVVTARERDEDGDEKTSRTLIEVSEVVATTPDAARFRVPDGYRRRDGFSWSVKH